MSVNKIKRPKTKGVCNVPVVMQLEALECGAACLTMILAYYGKWIPLEEVRLDCGVSRDGSNAKNVLIAARHYGLNAKGYRFEPEALKEHGVFPCIIHWNFNHFVVLDGFRGGKACINDPARGYCAVSMEEFDKSFTGVCMQFSPGENFTPSGKPKSMLSFASNRLRGVGAAVLFAVLTNIITSVIGMLNPGFSRVFLDRLLSGRNPGWAVPFFIILGAFNLIQIIMASVSAVCNFRIKGKIGAVGNASYMWKILKMPMAFFSQRMAGDIQTRKTSNATVANTLIVTFAPLVLNTVMMVLYFVVMIRYSVILTVIGLSAIIANAVLSALISKKRINITRVAMRDTAKLSASTVSGIEMMETIKASGAENGYFAKWAGYQASVNTQQVKYAKLNGCLGSIPAFLIDITGDAVLILGVWLTMKGQFTVGMIMAFQGFMTLFFNPAQTFITAGQTLQEMRTQMERIDDVMEYPDDDVFPCETADSGAEYEKLSGKIELKNVSFGYSPLASPLITGFNLTVNPGESIAIVGGSGCGKSTVSKLISGLYKQWDGEILFDGKPLSAIDKSVFSSSVAVVDQDIVLFEDTIANNIKMWDDSIEDFEMILAARDASLHDDIMKREGGYNHKLSEGGNDFSGGERQRIEIARVLAQDPTVIILDEATSALDAKTEYEVVKAIKNRGITCIVIAHRLSTVRACDEIIVMKDGSIVDRGTHKELMETSDTYRELVTSE